MYHRHLPEPSPQEDSLFSLECSICDDKRSYSLGELGTEVGARGTQSLVVKFDDQEQPTMNKATSPVTNYFEQ
jgi:hypothetical protein